MFHVGLNRGQSIFGPRIERPVIVYDVPGIADWLRRYPDSGWLKAGDGLRMATARRLLFLSWLVARGEVSDA